MKRTPIPKSLRQQVNSKYNGHCAYCGCKPEKLCVDHLVPVAKSHWLEKHNKSANDLENLMPACYQCNNYKLVFDLEQFRSMIQGQVNMARKYSVNFRFAEKYGLIQEIKKPIKFYFEELK